MRPLSLLPLPVDTTLQLSPQQALLESTKLKWDFEHRVLHQQCCRRSAKVAIAEGGRGQPWCRYSAALGTTLCANFQDLNAASPTQNCTSVDTNGSTIPIFQTTTKYDTVAWAAIWMYKVRTLHTRRRQQLVMHGTCTR